MPEGYQIEPSPKHARIVTLRVPVGEGAIESAIKRIINLRVKSNSTDWLSENAETMIRLRAWLKSGRADGLFRQTTYATIDLVT